MLQAWPKAENAFLAHRVEQRQFDPPRELQADLASLSLKRNSNSAKNLQVPRSPSKIGVCIADGYGLAGFKKYPVLGESC